MLCQLFTRTLDVLHSAMFTMGYFNGAHKVLHQPAAEFIEA